MTYKNIDNMVKIPGKMSASFNILKQGVSEYTFLFNLSIGKVITNVKTNLEGTIFNRRQCLTYADDVVILGRGVRYVTETVGKCQLR